MTDFLHDLTLAVCRSLLEKFLEVVAARILAPWQTKPVHKEDCMSDQYEQVRNLPIAAFLAALGIGDEWKPRKNGNEWSGRCPVHKPVKNTGSFSIHADGKFNCFSCGAKGRGAIDLVMAIEQIGFRDAVERLQALNIEPNHFADVGKMVEVAENPPLKSTYSKYFVESRWLSERGFSPETLEKFGVGGYDNPKRQSVYKGKILLPVRRWDGELVAYLARTKEPASGESKYIWPKGFHKHLELFGAWQIKNNVTQLPLWVAYVVESPFCVMKFAQLGLPAVSPFGWSVSPEQTATISKLAKGVVYLPDATVRKEEKAKAAGLLSTAMWVKTLGCRMALPTRNA